MPLRKWKKLMPYNREIQNYINRFYILEKYIYKNKNTIDFIDLQQFKRNFAILNLWFEEIKSSRKSIFIFGKMSSGKSTFLNLLLKNQSQKDILPTSTKTESRVIIRIENCDNEPYVEIFLKNQPFELDPNLKQYCSDQQNSICIPLTDDNDIENFHNFIQLNSSDPRKFTESIKIFYPFKDKFKDFVFYDTPGLGSSFSETDDDVYESFIYHSFLIWFINGKEPQMSDAVKQIVQNIEYLKKLRPNRLCILSTHYDLLVDHNNISETKTLKNCSKKDAKEYLKCKAKSHIDKILKKNKVNSYLKFCFIDLKRNKDNSQNTLADLEIEVSKKFKSIEIDMAMDLNSTLSKFIEVLFEKIKNEINKLKNRIRSIEKEKIEFINKLTETKKSKIDELEEHKEIFIDALKNQVDSIKCATTRVKHNKEVNNLEKIITKFNSQIFNKFNSNDVKIDVIHYDFKTYYFEIKNKKRKWIKNVTDFILPSDAIEQLRLKSKKKYFKNELKSKSIIDNDILTQIEEIFTELKKNVEKEYEEKIKSNSEILNSNINESDDRIKEIGKIFSEIKKFKKVIIEFNMSLKESLKTKIDNWEEPNRNLNTDIKFIKFLDLYRNIRYLDEIEKKEVLYG
jgi:hypothetical protein